MKNSSTRDNIRSDDWLQFFKSIVIILLFILTTYVILWGFNTPGFYDEEAIKSCKKIWGIPYIELVTWRWVVREKFIDCNYHDNYNDNNYCISWSTLYGK